MHFRDVKKKVMMKERDEEILRLRNELLEMEVKTLKNHLQTQTPTESMKRSQTEVPLEKTITVTVESHKRESVT